MPNRKNSVSALVAPLILLHAPRVGEGVKVLGRSLVAIIVEDATRFMQTKYLVGRTGITSQLEHPASGKL